MIPEIKVDWKAFEYKYSDNPQNAFENLSYYLFCHKFNQKNGIFRYFNQPHIETNPIQVQDKLIGFQAKHYEDSVTMSSKENELKEAVKGAARAYPGITTIYFYINKEFSPSSKKDEVKPAYQTNIEETAKKLGIEIIWQGRSNIEAELVLSEELTVCRSVFFQVNSQVERCCERIRKHKENIFNHIKTHITYKESSIVLEQDVSVFEKFLNSDNQVLIVDGDAGTGKSAWIKNALSSINEQSVIVAFKSTDFDMKNKEEFMLLYGELLIDEFLNLYGDADQRILYVDAVEKYFILENQQTFEDIIRDFINAGWKIVLTIRTAYKESFHSTLLNDIKVQSYHVNPITDSQLFGLANAHNFKLPIDKKVKSLICVPFYLGLYLGLEGIDDDETLTLSREIFEKKIWNDIIRNNAKRHNNMPTRRETALTSLTLKMLQDESYVYYLHADDDSDALSALEQQGIINMSDDTRKYFHGHDVFEELVVNHIFNEQFERNIVGAEFFSNFRTTLRIRKLFRNWLSSFANQSDHEDFIYQILEDNNVDVIWKDEILLTIISTESLKGIYYQIAKKLTDNNYDMLRKMIFLINTCCRVAKHEEAYFNRGSLLPFRYSQPSGYAWEALFEFIFDNKESLDWDKELLSSVINVLDSWTTNINNLKAPNTKVAGEIGLYLFRKLSQDKDFRYLLRDEQVEQLQKVLLNSAYMIKEDLCDIFQNVLDGIKEIDEETAYPFGRNRKINAPTMYISLAKRAISDIYHHGPVTYVMPEMIIKLMKKMWLDPNKRTFSYSTNIDEHFGIDANYSHEYYPASALRTPILGLLRANYKLATDFIIDFCNEVGSVYENSHLNLDYKECFEIQIQLKDQSIKQVASDRLWKMYRGTHVGSNLLESLLMGFESWFLDIVKKSDRNSVKEYCRYILQNSTNVMLTSIVVSIAEAYPEKAIDIVCDLLKTKDIFHLDSHRFSSEHHSDFMFLKNDEFTKERKESNSLPHRNVRLEDIILRYQINNTMLSQQEFEAQRDQVISAIDSVISDISSWSTDDKYAYYRMDIRRYKEIVDVNSNNDGTETVSLTAAFSDDMKEQSDLSQKVRDTQLKHVDLQMWSDYKFNNDTRHTKYQKYSDVNVIYNELNEACQYLCDIDKSNEIGENEKSLYFYKYISILSYVSTVLIRDYDAELTTEMRNLCKDIIINIGCRFTQMSDFEIAQLGNGIEAIVVGLILLTNESNKKELKRESPLYLLIKLILKDWSDDSRIIKPISKIIWKHNEDTARQVILLFSSLADQYDAEKIKNRERFSAELFFKRHQKTIKQILNKKSINELVIDFSKLSKRATFAIISLVSTDTKYAFEIAEQTKDIAMSTVFKNRNDIEDDYTNLIGYIFNYVLWFADVLLCCDKQNRTILIKSFLERSDMSINDNSEKLLTWLIQEQEILGKIEQFWEVWEQLAPRIAELSKEKERYYFSGPNIPSGKDRVITAYLFANTMWVENIQKSPLLPISRKTFFNNFINISEGVKAPLYAISKLLNTVGKETYAECGIEWIYNIVKKDIEYHENLYDYTLFYLEEYMGEFVANHRNDFKCNASLTQKTQFVLEYMVRQGSYIAFFIREQL